MHLNQNLNVSAMTIQKYTDHTALYYANSIPADPRLGVAKSIAPCRHYQCACRI